MPEAGILNSDPHSQITSGSLGSPDLTKGRPVWPAFCAQVAAVTVLHDARSTRADAR